MWRLRFTDSAAVAPALPYALTKNESKSWTRLCEPAAAVPVIARRDLGWMKSEPPVCSAEECTALLSQGSPGLLAAIHVLHAVQPPLASKPGGLCTRAPYNGVTHCARCADAERQLHGGARAPVLRCRLGRARHAQLHAGVRPVGPVTPRAAAFRRRAGRLPSQRASRSTAARRLCLSRTRLGRLSGPCLMARACADCAWCFT